MALRVFGRFLFFGGAAASVSYFIYRRFWKRKLEEDILSFYWMIEDKTACEKEQGYSNDYFAGGGIFPTTTDYHYCEEHAADFHDHEDVITEETDVEVDKSHNTDLFTSDDIEVDESNAKNEVDDLKNDQVDIDEAVKDVLNDLIGRVENEVPPGNVDGSFEGDRSEGSVIMTESSSLLDSKFDFEKWKWLIPEEEKNEEPKMEMVCGKKGRKKFKGLRKFFKSLSCRRKARGEDF